MDLFNQPDAPAHHTDDPETSRLALDAHEDSGNRSRNQRIVFALVRGNPGLTACELWGAADSETQSKLKELQEIRRRLTDLAHKGMVQAGASRRCRVRGSKQTTWMPFDGEGV